MRLLIALITAATACNAYGQQPVDGTTKGLLQMCKSGVQLINGESNLDISEAFECFGYVQGYVEAVGLLGGKSACIPQEATLGQVVRAVVKQLEERSTSNQFQQADGNAARARGGISM